MFTVQDYLIAHFNFRVYETLSYKAKVKDSVRLYEIAKVWRDRLHNIADSLTQDDYILAANLTVEIQNAFRANDCPMSWVSESVFNIEIEGYKVDTIDYEAWAQELSDDQGYADLQFMELLADVKEYGGDLTTMELTSVGYQIAYENGALSVYEQWANELTAIRLVANNANRTGDELFAFFRGMPSYQGVWGGVSDAIDRLMSEGIIIQTRFYDKHNFIDYSYHLKAMFIP